MGQSQNMSAGKRLGIAVFLISPIFVVGFLVWVIVLALRDPGIKKLPPVGAGAGATGGANAVGEFIKERRDSQPRVEPAAHSDDKPAQPAAQSAGKVNPVTLDTGFILVVSDKTGKSSASSPIFMASQMSNWSPGDERYKFTAQSDMRWRLHLTKEMLHGSPSTIEFKFTRGSWDLEELNADFTVPGNKQLPMLDAASIKPGEPPMIEYTVLAWSDTSPNAKSRHVGDEYRSVQAAGNLRRLQVRGGAGDASGKARDLLVWLPDGYDAKANAGKRYPVLYMHDGQNLFEKHANVPAEWRFDETMTELLTKNMVQPCIIVGVPHSGPTRTVEYLPPVSDKPVIDDRLPEGDKHLAWLIQEVMPRVERAFRVATGPGNTGVGGASLGGLISIYAGTQHPEIFGKVLAESPSLGFNDKAFWNVVADRARGWPQKMFLAVGGMEAGEHAARSKQYEGWVREFEAFARGKMPETGRVEFVYEPGATHNEEAWANRLPGAMMYLFPPAN
jgi:pullulanase